LHLHVHCVPKSGTPNSIDNFANSQWILKIFLLAESLENLR